jgi:lipopolysaccharide/colanic/teichoic acid biosynthesis glycosyltransferase
MAFPTTLGAEIAAPAAVPVALDAFAEAGHRAVAYATAKRVLDVAVAATLLVLLLPLFALIGLAVFLDDRGPVFYRGERVGQFGRRFSGVKFRSMRASSDSTPHAEFIRGLMQGADKCAVYKVPNDRRITRVGAFLRRTSLDELPQLWNVLLGQMSLVGPRPDVPYAAAEYAQWMRGRLLVKPGITGLWQVSGRSRLSLLDMYRLDNTYAAEASLLLDLRILVRTVPVVLGADGAA